MFVWKESVCSSLFLLLLLLSLLLLFEGGSSRENVINSDSTTSPHFPYGRSHFEENLMKLNGSLPKRKRKLQLETSPNLFVENLHTTRILETVHYVTDAKQMTDFFWFRDSGIRINVGLQNVQVIPHYREVDHMGDSEFELTRPINRDPKAERIKRKFAKVVQHLCRNPIPERYRINLEVFKDRLTSATSEVCDLDKFGAGICPKSVGAGESFIRRSLDEPCLRLSSYPTRLMSANNSILCTSDSPLLTEIFGFEPHPVRASHPDSKKCRANLQRCHKCLDHDHCQSEDELEKSCCQLECHNLPECKAAFSAPCTHPLVDCASGDVHRFTIQPIFQLHSSNESSTVTSYACHLHRVQPSELYQVWFYVTVPSPDGSRSNISFETQRVHFKVRPDESAQRFHFLSLEHGSGIGHEDDDVILEGEVDLDGIVGEEGERHGKFTMTSFEDFKNLFQDDVSHSRVNAFVRDVKLSRPFAYSTSTWSKDGCNKDMSLLSPVGDGNLQRVVGKTPWKREVNVMVEESLEYLIKSADDPPFIKLSVPGTSSVIRWWFSKENVSLLFKETFHASLTSEDSNRFWKFVLSGEMTSCPGYLGVTVNDLTELEEVSRLDILVTCPRDFRLVVHLPNWSNRNEKTFELLVDDSREEHKIFLNSARIDSTLREAIPVVPESREDPRETRSDDVPSFPVVIQLIIAAWLIHVVATSAGRSDFCLQHVERCCGGVHLMRMRNKSGNEAETLKVRRTQILSYCDGKEERASHKRFILSYVVFRIVFTFTFTLSASASFSYLCLPSTLESSAEQTSVNCTREGANLAALKFREKIETEAKLCDNYVEDLMEEMRVTSRKLKEISDDCFVGGGSKSAPDDDDDAIGDLLDETFELVLRGFESSLRKNLSHVASLLEWNFNSTKMRIEGNPWLSYLRSLTDQRKVFAGKGSEEEEEIFIPPSAGGYESLLERVQQNYLRNGDMKKFHSFKLDEWKHRPFISTKFFSRQISPESKQQPRLSAVFSKGGHEGAGSIDSLLLGALSEVIKSIFFVPLLVSLDCSLVFIRLCRLCDVTRRTKERKRRFFIGQEELSRLGHPSNSSVTNSSTTESKSPRLNSSEPPTNGDDSRRVENDVTSPQFKVILCPSHVKLAHREVTIHCRQWQFDEVRERSRKMTLVTMVTGTDQFPPTRNKEHETKGKRKVMLRVIVKISFFVLSSSIFVVFLILLWMLLESVHVLITDFRYQRLLGKDGVTFPIGRDLTFDPYDSAHLRHFDLELAQIRALKEVTRSVHENFTWSLRKRSSQVRNLSIHLDLLIRKSGIGNISSFNLTALQSHKCLHIRDFSSPLISPCSPLEDSPQSQPLPLHVTCRWRFAESARRFAEDALAKFRVFLVTCASLVWAASIGRQVFVIASRRIQVMRYEDHVLQVRTDAALKKHDTGGPDPSPGVEHGQDNRPSANSTSNFLRDRERAGLFVIELNKPLSGRNFRTNDPCTLPFSETKV